jgi:hypothetical protein
MWLFPEANFRELRHSEVHRDRVILRKPVGDKSQPLATFPRIRCSDLAWLCEAAGVRYAKFALQRALGIGACYHELPRIRLLRTRVNKGQKGINKENRG